MDAALAPLRLQGIRILNYIDDWLVLAQSERVAAQHRDVVLAHLKVLVLRLNAKKSVLSNSSGSTGTGCHGTDVADASSVRGSPIALLPGVLARVRRDEVSLLLVAPLWPGRVRFSDLISLLDGSPWEIPVRRDLLSQAVVFTPARRCGRFGCGPEGVQLVASGLSTEVVETILPSRAPSARKLYALKWELSLHGAEAASST